MNKLDHLLWGAPSLDGGIQAFEQLTGVRLHLGGRHEGFGTRNVIATFGDGSYFEIIAPDPQQSIGGTLGEVLSRRARPGLLTFAVNTTDIESMVRAVTARGLTARRVAQSRRRPDGIVLEWQLLYPEEHDYGYAMPFFIQWDTPHHPSLMEPAGLSLESFVVRHPRSDELADLFGALHIPVSVEAAPEPGFHARLQTPKGQVDLT